MQKKYILIAILVIGILLRATTLNDPFYGDDSAVAKIISDKEYFGGTIIPHPPLGNLILIEFTSAVGFDEWSFRFPTFFFACATIILLYFFAKKYYDEETALWSVFFLSFSAWHIYGSKTNFGGEAFLAFFTLLASFFFLSYTQSEKWYFHVLTGIFIGIACMIKEASILLFPICIGYYLLNKFKIKTIMINSVWMITGFSSIFIIFLIIDYFFNNFHAIQALLGIMISTGIEKKGYITPDLFQYIFSFFKILFWLTPLWVFAFILKTWKTKETSLKEHIKGTIQEYTFIYLCVYGLFFIFYISPSFDKPRYLLIISPFIAMYTGNFFAKLKLNQKQIIACALLTILFFTFFLYFNKDRNIISFDDKNAILNNIKTGQLNFDVGIISETGNPGIVININIFIIAYLLCTLFAITYILLKNPNWIIIILLFGAGFGYNIFLAEEFLFHWTSPDYADATQKIIIYTNENNLVGPIYLFKDPSMNYYLPTYSEVYALDTIQNSPEKIQEIKTLINEKGGTILLVDIPFINKDGELWQFITQTCEEKYVVSDNGIDIGYVFSC
ncbi:MAG: glycosyltransferase family 39 protein [Candidatus Woesearchaeota archaeon]|jgi:hypothetical protein